VSHPSPARSGSLPGFVGAWALFLSAACSGEVPTLPPPPLDLEAELRALEDARDGGQRAGRPEALAAPEAALTDEVSVGARMLDLEFRPLAGGTLAWCEADAHGLPVERARASADANGTLWLTVPRSAFVGGGPLLVATAPGCARRLLGTGAARFGEATLSLGEMQLAPGGELFGRVQDESGRPLADARVWLGEIAQPAPDEAPELARFYPDLAPLDGWLVAVSQADGSFHLPHVPPGTWDVLALGSPGAARRVPSLGRVQVAAGLRAEADQLVLAAPRAEELVRGRVRGAAGAVRAHARLTLVPADGRMLSRSFGATAGEDGHFELLVPEQSTWVVEARDAAGLLAPVRSEVVTGGDELELVLGD